MPFTCSICGEESTRICVWCTKDACVNHICEKCGRCSDCCECEVALDDRPREFTPALNALHPKPPAQESAPEPEPEPHSRDMQKRTLGNSDLNITPIGIGAWAMGGGDWRFSWGPQNDADSIAAIRKALDSGINWIDTAAVYGLGHSEEIVGQAVAGYSPRPYLFTKCERVWNERREIGKSLKADSIRREVEASLRRLQTDVIDLYQMHWPEPEEDLEEGWATMAALQREGKVRWIGLSNCTVEQMERCRAIAPITSLQPPYSIISPDVERSQLPYCQEHGIGVIVYSPMKSGLLTGAMTRERIAAMPADDHRRLTPNFQEPLLTRNLALAELLREIGSRHGRTPGEVAIAWTLRHPAVTAAIVGMRSANQVDGVIGAAEFRLTPEEVAEIETFRDRAATA